MTAQPMEIERYEKRFGLIAIEKGIITPDDLVKALTVQVYEDIQQKTHRLIGQIFLDGDTMSPEQIDEVLRDVFKA